MSRYWFVFMCAMGVVIGGVWWGLGTVLVQQGWKGGGLFVGFGPVLLVGSLLVFGVWFMTKRNA